MATTVFQRRGERQERLLAEREQHRREYLDQLPPEAREVLAGGLERLDRLDEERGRRYPPNRLRSFFVYLSVRLRRERPRGWR